ncbi:MAG: tRNA (adenosine(37)-N6)-threonylcarbamoyltransferase complex transferase subunit TsaD [Bacteroidia bacterium]|nr:tRNA (adenosine(37)-N6)-threonylcarbamoyltransferase complex transferase subunit TsaD [Bacteroidia bacterium]
MMPSDKYFHTDLPSSVIILGIESSCDDTSASIIRNNTVLSNLIANQDVHRKYGGVVPELASRAHQKNIIPVVDQALKEAKVDKKDLSAIAYTKGPGLMGSLLVGSSFAKSLSASLNIPLIGVNHLEAHVLANFIGKKDPPQFPFICLTVSGGHTQIVLVRGHLDLRIIGQSADDAAGESFDKIAKIMGLPYPGGPEIDKLSKIGDPKAFSFPKPKMPELNFSFSGLKTAVFNFLHEQVKGDPAFLDKHLNDVCASLQHCITDILLEKLELACEQYNISEVALAGGVAANSHLRDSLMKLAVKKSWQLYIPDFQYCTDNGAMIAIAGYYKYLANDFDDRESSPKARYPLSV